MRRWILLHSEWNHPKHGWRRRARWCSFSNARLWDHHHQAHFPRRRFYRDCAHHGCGHADAMIDPFCNAELYIMHISPSKAIKGACLISLQILLQPFCICNFWANFLNQAVYIIRLIIRAQELSLILHTQIAVIYIVITHITQRENVRLMLHIIPIYIVIHIAIKLHEQSCTVSCHARIAVGSRRRLNKYLTLMVSLTLDLPQHQLQTWSASPWRSARNPCGRFFLSLDKIKCR